MANYFKDNDDLQFYFDKGIPWDALVEVTEQGFNSEDGPQSVEEAKSFYGDIVDMVGGFVAAEVAPHVKAIDAKGVHLGEDGEAVTPAELEKIMTQLTGMDLHGMCLPRELGGLNCPMVLYFVVSELLGRADVSLMAHYGFHGGIALAMVQFAIREGSAKFDDKGHIVSTRFDDYIAEIVAGKAWGCMDITEPDAGSDMAALRSVGKQDADGNWRVSGEKIFITSGHGKYHFVIARTEEAKDPSDPFAGLGGLSFFLVKTYDEDAQGNRTRVVPMTRIEEKLGHHGSVTAALAFEDAPAELVGKRGEGFRYMLLLMNNARLGVGFESIAVCEAAYRAALDYASERRSMGKTLDRHELIADYLDEMGTTIQGLRALAMWGAFHNEMATKLEIGLDVRSDMTDVDRKRLDRLRKGHQRKARRATPLLKYLAAEKAVEMARQSVQIHGGNGYMKEYPPEKLLRDAMVMPIYEGTSQIQSLMAMKDTLLGIMRNPQLFLRRLAQTRWRSLSARDPMEKRVAKLQILSLSAQQFLMTKTATNKVRSLQKKPFGEWTEALRDWDPRKDFAFAMLHAERLTHLLALELTCEVLLEQAKKFDERVELLERYLDRAEPRARALHDEITTTGARILELLHVDAFEEGPEVLEKIPSEPA